MYKEKIPNNPTIAVNCKFKTTLVKICSTNTTISITIKAPIAATQ